jgi:hypothetical protein
VKLLLFMQRDRYLASERHKQRQLPHCATTNSDSLLLLLPLSLCPPKETQKEKEERKKESPSCEEQWAYILGPVKLVAATPFPRRQE